MKLFMKLTALMLCIAMLCLSLCSCQYLDEAKANTAVYTDNSKDSFTFRGSVYKQIELSDKLSFIMKDVNSACYVTLPDVPVLLSKSYGDMMNYDESDGTSPTVISVFKNLVVDDSEDDVPVYTDEDIYIDPIFRSAAGKFMDDSVDNYGYTSQFYTDYGYFVREDQYGAVKNAVNNAVIDHYFTLTYTYDNPEVPWQGGKYLPTILDEDATEVIKRTLSGDKTATWDDISTKQEWYSIALAACDKDMMLCENNSYSSNLMLITTSTDYYLFRMNDATKLYHVSDDDFEAIRKVYSMCKESLDSFDVGYYRDNADKISNTYDYPER